MDDALETLGARPGNSYDVVRKKYKNLALRHHPNKPGGDEEKFKKIQEAWNLLKNLQNSWNGAIPGTPDENIFETHLRAMRKVGVDRRNSYRNAMAKFDAFENKNNVNVKKTKTFMKRFLNDEAWSEYMSEIMKNAYDASNRTSSMPYPETIFQNDLSKKPNNGKKNNNGKNTRTNNNGKNTQTNNMGTQTNNTGTRTNNMGTQTNNTGTRTNNTGTRTNNTGTQTNNMGTQTNNMGTQTNNTGTRTNNTGTQTNNMGTQTNNMGTRTRKTNYGLSGNSIIQNNLSMPKNNRKNTGTKTNNNRKTTNTKKPSIMRRPTVGLIERLFGVGRKTPLVDDRIFGAKILGDDLYEYALDSSKKTMIRIFATKKAARREMEFIARADPLTVPRVYEMFKHYPSGRYVVFMERLYFDGPLRCADVARIQKIVESLHSRGIAHYCIDGKHLGRRGGKGPLVVFGFEHAVQFGRPVTPRDHDRVMRRDSRPLSDLNGPILLTSVLCR